MLENTEGAFKNGHSSESGDIVYTRGRQAKQKRNTICVGRHYAPPNTNNVNKMCVLLLTLDSKHIHFIYSRKPYDNTCLF